jgi:hypothetical protein
MGVAPNPKGRERVVPQFRRVGKGGWDLKDRRTPNPSTATQPRKEPAQQEAFNDPSAGSPTETLLRLLLPLNAKV